VHKGNAIFWNYYFFVGNVVVVVVVVVVEVVEVRVIAKGLVV
jgi:hypothetical protein